MPSIDWPLEQLRKYLPPLYREPDFDHYWKSTVAEAVGQPLNAELIPYDLPARGIQAYAVRFDGFGGGRIAGWYLRPDSRAKMPGVCFYHGYSGRAARPFDLIAYAAQGICVLSMDCRGQNGQSQDAAVYPEGAQMGWMTQGIRDPQKRLAKALLRLAEVQGAAEAPRPRITITQKELGRTIGLSRESTNKWLREWERAGHISLEKGGCTIDRGFLAMLAIEAS